MRNNTLHPMDESAPLIKDEYIFTSVRNKSTPSPKTRFYGEYPAEWIEDVEAIDLVTELRDKYEVELTAMREEIARLSEEVVRLQYGL